MWLSTKTPQQPPGSDAGAAGGRHQNLKIAAEVPAWKTPGRPLSALVWSTHFQSRRFFYNSL